MLCDLKKYYPIILLSFLFACRTPKNAGGASTVKAEIKNSIPFHTLRDENDLDVLIKEIGNARIVLLGESTHGTHEFYEWRAAITKKLIEEKGFNFIAVEGDWVDSYKVNQFINGSQQDSVHAAEILKQYDRWPSSMWGNQEMASMVEWLNQYNQQKSLTEKIGYYGLDIYSFWEWTRQAPLVNDAAILAATKDLREKFSAFDDDGLKYSSAVRNYGTNYGAVTNRYSQAVAEYTKSKQINSDTSFLLQQQAALAADGEKYFRVAVTDKVQAWNIRDGHMTETIRRLLDHYGKNSKAIIWVHNGHAGDVQYSQMGQAGYTSVAQLLRAEYGRKNIFRIGFGTDRGKVTAGLKWNSPIQNLDLPAAKKGSWENVLHELSPGNKIILSGELSDNLKLKDWIPFRSVGAAYSDNAVYGQAIIPQRFDAFVFIDSTTATRPIIQ